MKKETMNIVNEIIYQQYFMSRNQFHELIEKNNLSEYIALKQIAREKDNELYDGKVYLKDLSLNMQMSNRQMSEMIGNLRDRGLIIWRHDGDGSEGTYVIITEEGRMFIDQQEELFAQYFGNVVEKYGRAKTMKLLGMVKDLQVIMTQEIKEIKNQDGESD